MKTVKPMLRDQPAKDGNYGIYIRVIENRKIRKYGIKEKVGKSYWNDKKGEVLKSHPDAIRINKIIRGKIELLGGEIDLLTNDKNIGNDESFIQYWEKHNRKLLIEGSIGNYRKMGSSLNLFKEYLNGKDILFSQMTKDRMYSYLHFLREKYDNQNTIQSYFKKLKRVVNVAIQDERIITDPFIKFEKIPSQPVISKSLNSYEFKKMMKSDLSPDALKGRDIFLTLFYMQGCRVGDLLLMKISNLELTTIEYKMKKTGHKIIIPLSPDLINLILKLNGEKYKLSSSWMVGQLNELKKDYKNEYMFPFLKNGVHNVERINREGVLLSAQVNEYNYMMTFTTIINKWLKTLSDELGFKITSHSARHTYSQMMIDNGATVYELKKFLNHQSLNTTEKYLKSLNTDESLRKNIEFYMKIKQSKKLAGD